jgi:ribosomal protein L40E
MANRTDLANLNTLINAVNVGYKGGLQVTAPGCVVVDSFGQPNRQILHLLNYNYNVTASNIQVSWKLPTGLVPGPLMVESPDNPSDVQLQYAINNGWLQFTVPSLGIWDIVVLNLGGITVAGGTTSTASTSASSTSLTVPTVTSAYYTTAETSPPPVLPMSYVEYLVVVVVLGAIAVGAIMTLGRKPTAEQRTAKANAKKGVQFCINCGAELPDDSKLCNKCGPAQS